MADRTADIVVVGGAAVGSAIAYFLKRDGFGGRVVVVEKDPSYQWCASTRAVAGIRQQFSTRENIRLSQFGIGFYRGIRAEFGDEADIALRERGYMVMATPAGLPALEANVALQQALGADIELLSPDAIRSRFPWLSVEGLAGAGWGRSGEGWIDPSALLQLLRRGAIARGAEYLHGEVAAIDTDGGRIEGVTLADGSRIATGTVVCAAGWHSARIAAMVGLPLPVRPRKRVVFVVDCPEELPGAGLMIDPSGLYFRPEGRYFLAGVAPPETDDPDCEDFDIDHGRFETDIWPALAARVPAMQSLKVRNAWCCHYDLNTLDHNAILGRHPELPSFVTACGFSGHGLQHAPGVGRAIAELVLHGGYRTIDLTRFGHARVARGEPILESNVY